MAFNPQSQFDTASFIAYSLSVTACPPSAYHSITITSCRVDQVSSLKYFPLGMDEVLMGHACLLE